MAMRKPVMEWRPEVKNAGTPLGPARLIGEDWDGFHAFGEVLARAGRHGASVRIVGPLAEYTKTKLKEERDGIRRRLHEAKKAKCADCRHLLTRHDATGRCRASYSAGPSGTFRCPCAKAVR